MVQTVEVVGSACARQDGEASIAGMDGQLLEQSGLAACGFAGNEQQVNPFLPLPSRGSSLFVLPQGRGL